LERTLTVLNILTIRKQILRTPASDCARAVRPVGGVELLRTK
jgi:hypothetical protein